MSESVVVHARRVLGAAVLGSAIAWSVLPARATDSSVVLNTKTLKYHCPSCEWARRCTRNCISVSRAEAEARGAVACKVCQGRCN